jgi:hypothetical protein
MASLVQWLAFSGASKSDGTPVSSGTAWFFIPGSTSSQVTVYADADETEPVAQPIVLDAGGRAQVYVADAAAVLIQDSTGANITVTFDATSVNGKQCAIENDQFTGTLPPGSGPLFGYGGKTNVDLILTKLGVSFGKDGQYRESENADVTARSYHDVLHNCVRVKDYGAKGAGGVDDTVAIQKACNRATALGKPLYIEAGTYITSNTINTGAISIFGDGDDLSIIKRVAGPETGASVLWCSAGSGHIELTGFRCDANVAVTNLALPAIVIATGDKSEMANISAYGSAGIDVSGVTGAKLTNCKAIAYTS